MTFWILVAALSVAIILFYAWIGMWGFDRYMFAASACLRYPNKKPSPEQMDAMLAEWRSMWRSREGLYEIFKNCGWLGFKRSLPFSSALVALIACTALLVRKYGFFI